MKRGPTRYGPHPTEALPRHPMTFLVGTGFVVWSGLPRPGDRDGAAARGPDALERPGARDAERHEPLRGPPRVAGARAPAPRTETLKFSADPALESKVRDVVGLYLDPPAGAVVLSVDEKTQIHVLDRTQPMLPMRPGQVERHIHDYCRHGATCLFAALEVGTGQVTTDTRARHTAPTSSRSSGGSSGRIPRASST